MTKDGELFECPHCKSTFSKDFAKNRMKKFGKDKQFFYNTKHCPNCDGRILMKDQNKDALRKKIEQLKQYAYQCGITGDLEEKRDALKEAANLEAEFKSLIDNLPIKDTEGNKARDKRIAARDTALKALDSLRKDMKRTKDTGKVEVKRQSDVGSNQWGIYVNGKLVEGGFFSKEVAEETASKNYGGAKDSKDAASVALKKLGQVRKQVKDATFTNTPIEEHKGYKIMNHSTGAGQPDELWVFDASGKKLFSVQIRTKNEEAEAIASIKRRLDYGKDSKIKDATNYNGERVFQTYEAWKRACRQIDPNVKFDGDIDICQAGKIGEWDGDKGVIYNTKDSKTKDGSRHYHIEKYANEKYYVEDPEGGDETGPFPSGIMAQIEMDKRNDEYEKKHSLKHNNLLKDSKPTAKDKMLKDLDSLKKDVEGKTKDVDLMVGKHNDIPDDQFDANELAMGIKVEMEHTDDPDIAKSIAKDHLMELKNYYTLLLKMEKEAKGK